MTVDFVLTEAQIEAIAEGRMNRLDRFLMAGMIDQAEYDREAKRIAEETEKAHAIGRKARNPSVYKPSKATTFTTWTREGRFS